MDGHARTATELGVVAQVSPSTASVHLTKLKSSSLVEVVEDLMLNCCSIRKIFDGMSHK
jgi:DNA-binding transcriptional ArsR family regulator